MSSVDVMEIGRGWCAVTIDFSPEERARISQRELRDRGGRLRFSADGRMQAKFHFNLRDGAENSGMVRLLAVFGEGGEFATGTRRFKFSWQGEGEPEESMMQVQEKAEGLCRKWCEDWQDEARLCLREKLGRVQTLRRVQSVAGPALSEGEIRSFLERELRRRYKSDIFCATVLWRQGWPDTRQKLRTAAGGQQAASAAS